MKNLILTSGLLLLIGCAKGEREQPIPLDCNSASGKYSLSASSNTFEVNNTFAEINNQCRLQDIACNYDMEINQPDQETGKTTITINSSNNGCIEPKAYTNCEAKYLDERVELKCGNRKTDNDYWFMVLIKEIED